MTASTVTGRGQGSATPFSRGGDETSIGVEKLIGKITSDQINFTNFPIVSAERRLTVSNTSPAQFSTIQSAIDSITDASPTNKYFIDLITTDIFEENVVLKESVYIIHSGFDQMKTAIVTSSSGDTMLIPTRNCGLIGFSVQSTSPVATDAAVRTYDSIVPIDYFTIVKDMNFFNKGAGVGYWLDSIAFEETVAYNCTAGSYGNIAIQGSGGILAWTVGGVAIDSTFTLPLTAIKLINAFGVIDSFAFLNDGIGYSLDVDNSTAIIRSSMSFNCSNLINLANASTGVFLGLTSAFAPTGTPLSTDATSIVVYGDSFSIDGPGTSTGFGGTGWLINPVTVFLPLFGLKFSAGTELGPDQRPTAVGITPAAGTVFFASDAALGGGPGAGVLLYYIPGTGWIDFTGAVHV